MAIWACLYFNLVFAGLFFKVKTNYQNHLFSIREYFFLASIRINSVASRVFGRPAFFILGPHPTDHQAEALLMISYKIHLSSQLVSPTLKSFPGLDKVPCSRCSWSNPPTLLIHFHSTDTLGSHCLRAGFSLT